MKALLALCTLGLSLTLVPPAFAQVCEDPGVQTQLQYLRRLSLDLRGRLPSVDELSSVVTNQTVDPAIIDAMLDSEDFIHQVQTHHRDLLWTNVADVRIASNSWILRPPNRNDPAYWVRATNRALAYRGAPVPCLNELARFDPTTGAILTTEDPNDPTIRREGWVEVEPYWAPGTTVRVCAFDAQESLQGTRPNGQPANCATTPAPDCGCGPNLQWCQSPLDQTNLAITESLNDQLLRFMSDIVRTDRPYSDVILAQDMPINGPIAHWLQYQSQTGGLNLPASPQQGHPIPDLPFNGDTWQTVERQGRHAGVLTMAGFLFKFASNRGRANRFYNAFLCRHFESSEPMPPATDDCHAEEDLTKRCGCKGCHQTVEPAAAYWGRWAETGLLPLDEGSFPKENPQCATPQGARNGLCRLFYFTERDVTNPDTQNAWLGLLKPYVYADATREANIEVGPAGIAQTAVSNGDFARCTVENIWQRFVARTPTTGDRDAIDALTTEFAGHESLKQLVKALVTRPEYVQAGRF